MKVWCFICLQTKNFRPQLKKAGVSWACTTDNNRQNSKITDSYRNFLFLSDSCLHMGFYALGISVLDPSSRSHKKLKGVCDFFENDRQ